MHQRKSLQATVLRLIAVGIYFAFFSVQLSCQYHIALQQTRFPHTVILSAKSGPDVVRAAKNDKDGFRIRFNKRYQPESFMELSVSAPALVPVYRVLEKQS